jgi:uncharacterized protein YwqG
MINFFSRLFGHKERDIPIRDVSSLVSPLTTPAVQLFKDRIASFSHFGGSPDLPQNIEWPEKDGVKLGFLARLSLAEIQNKLIVDWLPKSGALLFFYDMENQPWGFDPNDRGSWAVLLVADLPAPIEQFSDGPNGNDSPFAHQNVSFRSIHVLPSWERDAIRSLQLSEKESDEYFKLSDMPFREMPKHQIAGFPAIVQGDGMELESQLASNGIYCGNPEGYKDPRVPSLTESAKNWRLLLQIDTDDSLDVMWGDCGTIYFWVEENEARTGNFENTWLILQCS